MQRSRLAAFLSVLLVFLSGGAVGALAYRLYVVKTVVVSGSPTTPGRRPQMTAEEVRDRIVAHLRDAVKLDAAQVTQLQTIMDETRDSFLQVKQRFDSEVEPFQKTADAARDKLHDTQVTKVKAILRPDQQALYDKYLADRAADRKRRQQRDNKK